MLLFFFLGNYKDSFFSSGQELGIKSKIYISYYTSISQTLYLNLYCCIHLAVVPNQNNNIPSDTDSTEDRKGMATRTLEKQEGSISRLDFLLEAIFTNSRNEANLNFQLNNQINCIPYSFTI